MKKNKISKLIHYVCLNTLGDVLTTKLQYLHQRKKWPNFNTPEDLAERLLSARLNPRFDVYAQYADKVQVREYVKRKGLEHILLKHYGVWDRPEDIDFNVLPEKFILKANNGCGNHIICRNKNLIDKEDTIRRLKQNIKLGKESSERHYRAIVPKVLCEELMETADNKPITDYKIQCINGNPDHFFVATERGENTKYCTLDFDWNLLPYTKPEYMPSYIPQKPKQIEKLIDFARILSEDFECVRVDLYEHNDRIYFGELTFSPWGGYMYSYTDDAIRILGDKFKSK